MLDHLQLQHLQRKNAYIYLQDTIMSAYEQNKRRLDEEIPQY